jgi:ABC-type branched-subunit amino acid transport system substrate-binding protein
MDGPGATAAGPVAAENNVPFVSAVTRPDLREKCKPWGVSYMTDSADGSVLAAREWLKLNPDIKSVVTFYMPSDPAQVEEYALITGQMKKDGVKVLKPVEVTTGQIDMGSAVVKAMNLKPDGYFAILRTGEYAKVVTELHNRGMTDGRRICATFAAFSANLFDLAKGNLEDTYIWNKMDLDYDSNEWRSLVKAYKDDHKGKGPMINTLVGYYDALYAFKDAVETLDLTGDPKKLKQERKKISDYFFDSKEFKGLQGSYRWDKGKKLAPIHFMQIRNNKAIKLNQFTE